MEFYSILYVKNLLQSLVHALKIRPTHTDTQMCVCVCVCE